MPAQTGNAAARGSTRHSRNLTKPDRRARRWQMVWWLEALMLRGPWGQGRTDEKVRPKHPSRLLSPRARCRLSPSGVILGGLGKGGLREDGDTE